MPTAATVDLQRTKNEYEFENMVADVLSVQTGYYFHTFGRKGQKQYGIDIISVQTTDIVGQCKNYSITISDIDKILNELNLIYPIKTFIIATSMNCDKYLQLYVLELNQQKKYDFNIQLLFWDDISPVIFQHNELFFKYYGNYGSRNLTIQDIVNYFNNEFSSCQVIDLFQRDVLDDGIPFFLPYIIDCFCYSISKLLSQNLILQKEDKYECINAFITILGKYAGYLGLHFFYEENFKEYRYIQKKENSRDEMISNINETVRQLDMIFSRINDGMTMFP